jgi:hypothetical protein
VLADAINRAGSTDEDKIREALIATNIPGDQTIMPWKVSTRRLPPCRRERAFDLRGVCMSAVKIKGSQQHGDHHWG